MDGHCLGQRRYRGTCLTMPVYPVGPRAAFVSSVYSQKYIVKNTDPQNTVYLGQASDLTIPTRAFSLPPGSTLNWSGETELWAMTDPGKTAEIELLYTGENSFSPGPSVVSLKNTAAVLVDNTAGITVGNGTYPIYAGSTGDASTISVRVDATLSATPFITSAIAQLQVAWLADDGVTIVSYDWCYFWSGGLLDWKIPVRGSYMTIQLTVAGGIQTSLPNVFAHSALLGRLYYQEPPKGIQPSAACTLVAQPTALSNQYGFVLTKTAANSVNIPIASYAGDANMYWETGGVAGPHQGVIGTFPTTAGLNNSGIAIARRIDTANTTYEPTPVIFPERPAYFASFSAEGIGASTTISINYMGNNQ